MPPLPTVPPRPFHPQALFAGGMYAVCALLYCINSPVLLRHREGLILACVLMRSVDRLLIALDVLNVPRAVVV